MNTSNSKRPKGGFNRVAKRSGAIIGCHPVIGDQPLMTGSIGQSLDDLLTELRQIVRHPSSDDVGIPVAAASTNSAPAFTKMIFFPSSGQTPRNSIWGCLSLFRKTSHGDDGVTNQEWIRRRRRDMASIIPLCRSCFGSSDSLLFSGSSFFSPSGLSPLRNSWIADPISLPILAARPTPKISRTMTRKT